MFRSLCFALLTLPLIAQDRPNPFKLALELVTTGAALMAKLQPAQPADMNQIDQVGPAGFFGVVIMSPSADMIFPPGLPPLLASTLVIGAGWTDSMLQLKVPNQHLPFDVYCQGIGVVDGRIEASPLVTLRAEKKTDVDASKAPLAVTH